MSSLIIGPWGHGSSQKFGALDFGPTRTSMPLAIQLRWYDYFLKGIDNGLTAEPPVKLFVMGRNEWVQEREYPLARTQYRPMYFASGGARQQRSRRRPAHVGQADGRPRRSIATATIPTIRCRRWAATTAAARRRRRDRRISDRSRAARDILIYTSDYLDEEIEVTGPVKVVLHASSDAVDTDFVAKLVDVYPDGSSYNMAEGILRARYRDGPAQPRLLTPGEVYRMEIDLVGTSVAFRKGHRIRVHVTSSHFPQFDRHPNTGATFGTTSEVRVAQQTIHHDAARPSHILLPVIPGRGQGLRTRATDKN